MPATFWQAHAEARSEVERTWRTQVFTSSSSYDEPRDPRGGRDELDPNNASARSHGGRDRPGGWLAADGNGTVGGVLSPASSTHRHVASTIRTRMNAKKVEEGKIKSGTRGEKLCAGTEKHTQRHSHMYNVRVATECRHGTRVLKQRWPPWRTHPHI